MQISGFLSWICWRDCAFPFQWSYYPCWRPVGHILDGLFPDWLLFHWSICLSLWYQGSLVAQLVKNLPVIQETQVQFLGQEDPLEKEMAITHSSILAWRIPWTEEPDRSQSVGSQESDMTHRLNHHHHQLAFKVCCVIHWLFFSKVIGLWAISLKLSQTTLVFTDSSSGSCLWFFFLYPFSNILEEQVIKHY